MLSFVFLFASCITSKDKLYLQKEEGEKTYRTVPFQQYRLGINDEIVYYMMTTSAETQYLYNAGQYLGNGIQSITFRIYEDGCVVLPTIGKVPIAGLTIREAEKVITEKFSSIVTDTEVKIALANNYFYVQGDGGKGQFYVYKENLNIFQALAMAGDISSIGDKKHIKIIRKGADGRDHIESFDIRKESIVESDYYYIHPNDVIYIPTNPNSFFRIESVSSFVSFVVAPISLVIMSLSYLKFK
jgi:polysaccharide export outer membrane protein